MRYVVVGAGAVGGTIGGLLAEVGRDVVLVARGPHLSALRSGGLRLTTVAGTRTVRCEAVGGPDEVGLRPDDVLVLAVKSQDTERALADWGPRPVAGGRTAAEDLLVVLAQNGVDNERAALRRFARVAGMCVYLPATHLEPGAVAAEGVPVPGILTLGGVPAGGPADPALPAVAADLVAAGFRAPVVADVMAWKYAKLLANLGNAVDALCGDAEGADELSRRARAEGAAVLAAVGIAWTDPADERAARDGFTVAATAERRGSSSWQSLARGTGSIEAAHLNGEIVLLGRLAGVPAPVNAALLHLAERAAATRQPPGAWDPADVLALAAAAEARSAEL